MEFLTAQQIAQSIREALIDFKDVDSLKIGVTNRVSLGEHAVFVLGQPFEPFPTEAETIIRTVIDGMRFRIEEKPFHTKQLLIIK